MMMIEKTLINGNEKLTTFYDNEWNWKWIFMSSSISHRNANKCNVRRNKSELFQSGYETVIPVASFT